MSDKVQELQRWVAAVSGPEWYWYVKQLSGNDTLLNESHQAGPYIPKGVIFELFPSVAASTELNPRAEFDVEIDSHGTSCVATVIWYNNRIVRAGTRNEARITNWGGRSSPVLDPEATGSICVFAFHRGGARNADVCRVWVCSSPDEEEIVTDLIGPVEPGSCEFLAGSQIGLVPSSRIERDLPCRLTEANIPDEWRFSFPEASEIVDRAAANLPSAARLAPDDRLIRRRICEYEIFRSLEEYLVLPRIREGFATVDIFVGFANSVTNRRKSRSGASLELHARKVFEEENVSFSHDAVSEGHKRPDFVFPSIDAYHDPSFPEDRIRMLAVKTTCKDRWRQILSEADRVSEKHLLTLQEGVSQNQFEEMNSAGVKLVVPLPLHSTFPRPVRDHLLSFSRFIEIVKAP